MHRQQAIGIKPAFLNCILIYISDVPLKSLTSLTKQSVRVAFCQSYTHNMPCRWTFVGGCCATVTCDKGWRDQHINSPAALERFIITGGPGREPLDVGGGTGGHPLIGPRNIRFSEWSRIKNVIFRPTGSLSGPRSVDCGPSVLRVGQKILSLWPVRGPGVPEVVPEAPRPCLDLRPAETSSSFLGGYLLGLWSEFAPM